ncbi:hypothetical protein M011DRAFT_437243 [Sporormia fimetaria CBS 119925]|uniref:Fanconi-associated nuclease n=1 Tax=Sporormia fimetaria CBS 119925 TaxID=1340428 RepID=A0A6A6VKW3_9PLEO|nr:hypothetical protein M011DRAFT_437243 [Sporormia fimetaria CBS 119925]
MPLSTSSSSQQNQTLTRFFQRTKATPPREGHERPAKRQRLDTPPAAPKTAARTIPDPSVDEDEDVKDAPSAHQTDLESALPDVKADAEAIEEYEAFKASQEEASSGNAHDRLNDRKWVRGKSSIYVDAFNLALDTVLEEESHLFDEAEMGVFEQWRGLDYEAQYLYVRLFLRKTAAWHRIRNLAYHSDISDLDAVVKTLQHVRHLPKNSTAAEIHPGEAEAPPETTLDSTFTFADRSEDEITTLEEASSLLKLDELKAMAKDAKVQGKNKTELLKALRRTSQRQVGLGYVGLRRSDTESSRRSSASGVDTPTPEVEESQDTTSEANRDAHFTRKILNETGPCIRLSLAPLKLFERVHLVFYRSTEWTEKSLTTIILAKIARRNFPSYIVSRSASIFPSRSSLLEFEAAIRTQYRVDSILEFNGRPTESGYDKIISVLEAVYPRWQTIVSEEQEKENSVYHSGEGAYLRRLSPAWIYTRIIHKATAVLARRKQHAREHAIISQLLSQRLFHHTRRGAWYQRKALLEEHYMASASFPASSAAPTDAQKKEWKRTALETCCTGLQDPLVHLIHHHDLQKRITKLERQVGIPKRSQHDFSHVRLARATERTVYGIQIVRSDDASISASTTNTTTPTTATPTNGKSTKTIWVDPANPTTHCSVEEMCLSHYRHLGYKGYHTESRLLRTLFSYLFLDILFLYVPNVFQTPFQTCPLDLHTDAFYPTRISEIHARLRDIENGDAGKIIRKVWDEHKEKRTAVVGLDWGFELKDLCEIVGVWEPRGLATACLVLAQEYAERGGGVPDLFLWREAKETAPRKRRGEVMFVEVKSENDRLSDTQRLWIDVLTGAGVKVELCHAVASEVRVLP